MMKIDRWKAVLSLIMLMTVHLHATTGEKVYQQKCASCHASYIPMTKLMENFVEHQNKMLNLKAPTLNQLSYRLKQQIGDPKGDEEFHRMEVMAFISDYLHAPDKEKSVCLRDVIQYFDTMPSMKGKITEEEIEAVSRYIYDFDTEVIAQKGVKHASFEAALQEAAKSDKIVMVEAVSKHCRFCKKMEREVFVDDTVVKALNASFVAVSVDISKEALPLGLTADLTPTFFFIDKDKHLLLRVVGAWNVEDFMEILNEAKAKHKGAEDAKH